MAKNRNTIEKRLRENEKKRKQQEKRDRKLTRKAEAADEASGGTSAANLTFSDSELKVFDHFHKYLMAPGQMLCLSSQQIESLDNGLDTLVAKDLLIAESMRGAYHLTEKGFDAMSSIYEQA